LTGFGFSVKNHLWRILDSWLTYSHCFCPHQGLGNLLIEQEAPPPDSMTDSVPLGEFGCDELLGGLPKHYERVAA
jgi:hypothetical protein